MNSETALITGASSGIGLHLAREFAGHGHLLVLVAPVEEELEKIATEITETYATKVRVLSGDLEQPELPQEIFENLQRDGIHVDILVSNAGFGFRGKWWEIPIEQDLATIRLNIEAVLRLTKLFLPPMVKLGRGRLLNTASVAGFEPGPCSPSIMPPRLSSFPGAKRSPSSWRHSRIGHRAVPRTYGH